MRCYEVMKTDVKLVNDDDTVLAALQKMRDSNIGFLPVIDRDKHVVGTITDRDIAMRVSAENLLPSDMKVRDVRSNNVVACHPEDDLHDAEQLMANYRKSRVLVIDRQGVLCGVISLSDIAQRDDFEMSAWTLRRVSSREASLN
jgi:CBS domain-containing protein